MKNNYYVYTATVDGVLRYVGKGKGMRYKHCNSGKSTCAELNRDFFEGKNIVVEKVHINLIEKEAERLESEMIAEGFDTLYNKIISHKPPKLLKSSLMKDTKVIERDLDLSVLKKNSKIRGFMYHTGKVTPDPDFDKKLDELSYLLSIFNLELVLLKQGNTQLLTIEQAYYGPEYTCLGCSCYAGAFGSCASYGAPFCRFVDGCDYDDMPGHKD